jgi:hypothetical protein
MANTHFTGPVWSENGFSSGTSASPVLATAAGNLNTSYASTSAATGDTRLSYQKLTFTSTGSGETQRNFTVVTGVGAAAGGTINGVHNTLSINGAGTISGAGNAGRFTIGGTSTNPGGTLAAVQFDSDFATGGTWTNASFMRCTNSGTGTVSYLMNIPKAMVAAGVLAASSHVIPIIAHDGTPYWIMANSAAS